MFSLAHCRYKYHFVNLDKYVLYEAYKISKGDVEAEVLYFGYWTEEDGLVVTDSNIWHRRANLKGKHLRCVKVCFFWKARFELINFIRVSALLNKPYETMVVDGCQSPECFQGMFADVFHELMDMMNFTYTMMMPKDGQWGAQRDNGSWTGVIGLRSLRKCRSAMLFSKNLLFSLNRATCWRRSWCFSCRFPHHCIADWRSQLPSYPGWPSHETVYCQSCRFIQLVCLCKAIPNADMDSHLTDTLDIPSHNIYSNHSRQGLQTQTTTFAMMS